MTDVVSAARNARECLAQGLSALQSPGVPEHLMAAAEPIARAMSNLHRIEATGGKAVHEAAPAALDAARGALSLLQAAPIMHPAVNAALEAVAGSLGVVHRLTQTTATSRPPAPAPVYSAPVAAPAPVYAPMKAVSPQVAAPVAAPAPVYAPMKAVSPQVAAPVAAPAPAPVYGAPVAPPAPAPVAMFAPMKAALPQVAAPAANQPAAGAFGSTVVVSNSMADTKQSAGVPPVGPDSHFAPNSTMPSQGNAFLPASVGAAQAPIGAARTQPEVGALPHGTVCIEADLGAHSPTNFYKGLSGNDVVDAGCIFVATYQVPPIGTNILLHVSLPGGYEFQAQAVVRWVQEPSSASDGTSPGFGAQFTTISQDGRQLVYRYVRNREPLFHDDF